MSEESKREDPQFETNSVDDLEELLARAANFADCYCSDTIASEFRDAREFVANDLRDELEDDPVLVTDGGQSETGISRMIAENRVNFGYFGGSFGSLGVGLGFLLYESGDLRLALGVLLAGSLVSLLSLGLILVERNKGADE